MKLVIHHHIQDSAKWDRSVKHITSLIEEHRLPNGIKPIQYLPSRDGRSAVCLWEAPSLTALRDFTERELAGARNEYFEVKEEEAMGLPKDQTPVGVCDC